MDINHRRSQNVQIEDYLGKKKEIVDKSLKKYIPPKDIYPNQIHEAINYSIFNGGKRLRPILAIAVCEMLSESSRKVLPAACAVELVHCSSLLLDDLPCIDNDDYRRGKPTCHKVFGENITILASYAMLSLAFEIVADNLNINKDKITKIVASLAHSAGSKGLVGGEVSDIISEGGRCNRKILEYIHMHKTAMLIEASVYIGAITGNADKNELKSLTKYGRDVGLAFQVADDILDITSSFKKMGKKTKKDAVLKKATYPSLYGIDKSIKILQKLKQDAVSHLVVFGKKACILEGIADYVASRTN